MSNVLIVGAKGMLGSMLAQVFVEQSPVLYDREELDITNLEQVREKVREVKPEVVINAAAYTDVDGAEVNRELAFVVNETGVKNLAVVAKELGATLVHYSTDYVFPGDKKEGYSEADIPGPSPNVYGESKLAGEQVLQAIAPTYYLIRTAWLYGFGGKNFVATMLKLAATQQIIQVVNDQHGSPTFTKDVAQFTHQLLEGNYPPGTYHATNSGQTTWSDFAREIFRLANVAIEVQPVTSDQFPRLARRPAYSMLINTKGPTMRSWQDALKEYIENR